jgi:hypothetical protein
MYNRNEASAYLSAVDGPGRAGDIGFHISLFSVLELV